MVSCAACGRSRTAKSTHHNITFHKFPKNEIKKQKWAQFVGRVNWLPSKSSFLCSGHFDQTCFDRSSSLKIRLHIEALPTIEIARIKYNRSMENGQHCEKSPVETKISSPLRCTSKAINVPDTTDLRPSKSFTSKAADSPYPPHVSLSNPSTSIVSSMAQLIKVEPCESDTELSGNFGNHCDEDITIKEEIDLGCESIELRLTSRSNMNEDKGENGKNIVRCTQNCVQSKQHLDAGSFDNKAFSAISTAQTIKVKTEKCIADDVNTDNADDHIALYTGKFELKTEEIDLDCDCNEHSPDSIVHLENEKLCDTYKQTNEPYKCKECDKHFSQKRYLNAHMKIHSSFKCKICKRKFTEFSELNRHVLMHKGEKRYKCSLCEWQFSQMYNLKFHMISHTGEKTFKCKICEKKFSHSMYLNRHLLTHTSKKPYNCNICERQFRNGSNLKRHMLTHTGEKTFKCVVCEKNFALKCTLNQHMFTHSAEKPYECEICKKQFSQLPHLKRHMTKHTSKKGHKCEFCDKRFSWKQTLKGHIAKSHVNIKKQIDEST